MNINLNLYKYFYIVAKNESYTKAAEELMVSQPSISYSVKVLEEQLDKKLVERTTKGIELTNNGKELYEKLKPIIESLESICNDNSSIRKITIGVRAFYAQKILPAKIRLLHLIFPELEIELKVRKSNELKEMLEKNELNIVLDDIDYSDDKFKSEVIKVEDNLFTTFFTSIERDIDIVTDEVIKKEKILTVDTNRFENNALDLYPKIKRENINSTPEMIEEVKINNRIGISANILIEDYLKTGEIKMLKTDYVFPKIEKPFFVTYEKKNYNKNLENIISILRDYDLYGAKEAIKNSQNK